MTTEDERANAERDKVLRELHIGRYERRGKLRRTEDRAVNQERIDSWLPRPADDHRLAPRQN